MKPWFDALAVGLGGFLGANARYWIGGWVAQRWPLLPYGTLLINVSGSFALGLLMAMLAERTHLPAHLRLLLGVGFLGAYTTFSTFEYETLALARDGSLWYALGNVVVSVVLGFGGVLLGTKLGQWLG